MGYPLELVMLNFSHSNFSNTRAALQQAYRTFECLQKWWARAFLRRVWRYAIYWGIKHGHLPRNDQAWRHKWQPPGWVWVDPLKDAQAMLMLMRADILTREHVCAKYGQKGSDVLQKRLRELQEERKLDPYRPQKPDKAKKEAPPDDA